MASGEQPSHMKGKKISSSSSRSRNDSDTQWLLIPNNLELGARAKPSKKQRNKEKHRQFQQENLSPSSEVTDSLSSKPRPPFHIFPRVKSNTATWLKDQYMNEEKSKRRAYESDEEFSDSDYHQFHQQNVHFPTSQTFTDMEHQEQQSLPLRTGAENENENVKSVKDSYKKETAMVCEILSHIQEFISEAESSWQKLDLSDEPLIKDAFIKLKNIVKDVEGGRETKLMLQHSATENGYGNDVSPSSSISRVSNSKENIANRDASGNSVLCNEDEEQDKCNHLHDMKISDVKVSEAESLSSDDCAIADVSERVAAVEWERRKLKNKLVELQEGKKIKDELRDLYYFKEPTNTASADTQLQKTKDKKKKKLYKLQSPSKHSKMTKGIPLDDCQNMTLGSDTPASRHSRSSASIKRDNVRKEQNSAFPARRHYEAEGRANEDPDIPAVPAPAISPALDNPEIQEKIRKLKVAQQHVKVIKDIVVSILENRKSGALIPVDQLRLLTPMQKVDQYFSDEESEEGSEPEKEFPSAVHHSSSEPTTTNVKEVCDGIKPSLLDVDGHKPEDTEEVAPVLKIEDAVGKEELAKLQSQFQQLLHIFPTSDRKNDDPVRSSGEGAYTLRKIPSRNVVHENVQKVRSMRPVPHQDNLQLTRQNIVTMESQNQNSNLHNRDCSSVKKDNINNLSGKMGKLSIQNSMNSSYPDVLTASNNNMDSMSTFSYELNQNHSLPNEVERKTILDILKQDKKKQKQYDRNQDSKICCNSSIDSEPLEGSNSALAIDSTTLAAWGGSSTQENFEDENDEQAESIEDQDDEEESLSVFDKGSVGENRHPRCSGQYVNMQQYIDSVANIADKRQRNFQNPVYSRNQNQPVMQSGYHKQSSQAIKSARHPISSSNAAAAAPRDLRDNTACASEPSEHCNQHLHSKFIQQLKNHVDNLNALCQNLYNERPQAAINSHPSQSFSHMPNTCAPLQPTHEIPIPYNQQLLLCLSQCYHALYMQQLEIHHLQRCMWQNIDGEHSRQQSNLNTRNNYDDPSFRPYCAPTWSNPFNPSNHFLPEQISPFSSASYFHLPMKHYPTHSSSSYATGSGPQPARAVIHPTSQNNVSSQETLNNQVPPRTRANNFWDNFRSYSRQNLLSTSNTAKRNENVASMVTPQVRQVYPLVSSGSPNRTADASNACCNASSLPEYNRAALNPEDTATKNIKYNASITGAIDFQKKDVPTNINSCSSRNIRSGRCHRVNLEHSHVQPTSNSSANLIQQQPLLQDNPKVGSFTPIAPNSLSQSVPEAAANSTPEVSTMLSAEHKSDCLIGLFHEAQALKSEALRQKALRMIRDLARSERHDSGDISQIKAMNENVSSIGELEKAPVLVGSPCCSKLTDETVALSPEITDNEKTGFQLACENVSGNTQNLPTAAIPPLSKHSTPRTVSTGAVRKKPKVLPACFPEPAPSVLTSSNDSGGSVPDNTNPSTSLPPNKAIEDIPAFITEKVVSDLVSMLPSLKRRLIRDGCSQTFWAFINDCLLESLRTHLFFCNINLSRKSMLHLRQTVYLFLSLFSEITLSDVDSDFVKYVEEFIYENITCFIASGQFAPVPSSLDEENCSLEMEDKMQELCVKMPNEPIEPISVKMPVRVPDEPNDQVNTKLLPRTVDEAVEAIIMKVPPVPPEENTSSHCGSIPNYDSFLPGESPPPDRGSFLREPEPDHGPSGDIRCDCNPEAEIEPEVEIGTEADLAEADQSPGQQGSLGDAVPAPENWTLDHEVVLLHRNVGAILLMNGEEIREIDNSSEGTSGAQCPDLCLEQEPILDDIPTKLCASEEVMEACVMQEPEKDEPLVVRSNIEDVACHSEFGSENGGDGGPTNLR